MKYVILIMMVSSVSMAEMLLEKVTIFDGKNLVTTKQGAKIEKDDLDKFKSLNDFPCGKGMLLRNIQPPQQSENGKYFEDTFACVSAKSVKFSCKESIIIGTPTTLCETKDSNDYDKYEGPVWYYIDAGNSAFLQKKKVFNVVYKKSIFKRNSAKPTDTFIDKKIVELVMESQKQLKVSDDADASADEATVESSATGN